MICFDRSLLIVAAFLLLTLLVGIYFSTKKNTFRAYAVGNKQFATATLVFTVLATLFGGGGLVRNVECVHGIGLWWIVIMLLSSFGLWIVGKLALRMGPFMQHFSIAETIGSVYGKYPRVVSAFVGICSCILLITIQINVIAQAISMCMSLAHPFVLPIFATLLLIFYSTFGGIRAVIFTDVLQFLTFSIIIPLLCWFIFVKVGKPVEAIIPMLQSEAKFQFAHLFHFDTKLISLVFFVLSNLVSCIAPQIMQRVYMASGPTQAQSVFSYATFFTFLLAFFTILVGLLVFVGAPDLPKNEIWRYIVAAIPPFFKGFLAIGLLAMAMPTADSCLNVCAIMVIHDIFKSLQKKKGMDDARQLKIVKRTTLVVGLFAMLLAFYCQDLLKLIYWSLDCVVPIVTAPFILLVFGFRSTARTPLIGMATGLCAILVWNKWVEPKTGMNGSFLAMVANGLAMMVAHYLFKQPENVGWVVPDEAFKQMQQVSARKNTARKEAIKHAWANKRALLSRLRPADCTLRLIGLYMTTTAILGYWFIGAYRICWAICQGLIGAFFTSYGLFARHKIFFSKASPGWFIGLCWLIGLAFYLPLNLLWHWWHLEDPVFTASLSLAHYAVILWVLPLYLGIGVVTITLLVAIYPITVRLSFPLLSSLFPLFMVTLLVVAIIICFKVKIGGYIAQNLYLKNQEKVRASRKLKESLYDLSMVSSTVLNPSKGYGSILAQVIGKVEQSISFLDGKMPLYKQDFQSIINKMYDWVAYFSRKEKAKEHALLQPTKITLDQLMCKVEFALSQEVDDPPKLFVEQIKEPSGWPSPYIVCDIDQIVYVLVRAVLRVGKLEGAGTPLVKIQLHVTSLQLKQADPIEDGYPSFMDFQATALVISQATTASEALPKVKDLYNDRVDVIGFPGKQEVSLSIDLQQETLSSIVGAHYGYLEVSVDQQQPAMLLVLPSDVTQILNKMTVQLPIDCLTSETPVTPKEQADSMMALMQFHDHVCKSSYKADPIDVATISGLLLLLRQHFGFKRHASGQLFYVRAVRISELVVEWVFHSPKVIYASLLYELVRHTCLPLSYIEEHYNLGVYAFVLNVVGIDKRQALDHPSLFYIQNRLKEALKEDHIQLSVLFIKLAERLYDLGHASSYIHLEEVQHMAQETLAIDVKLAHAYLGPEIGLALEKAAKQALKVCKDKGNSKDKDKDKE